MIRNDEPLDTTIYYEPEDDDLDVDDFDEWPEDDEDEDYLDDEDYWSNGYEPDPDDARDRMIEEGRWNGVD